MSAASSTPFSRAWTAAPPEHRVDAARWHSIAMLVACGAVATLPFLRPAGPGNTSPTDVAIALTIAAVGLWAWLSGARVRAPYGVSMALIVVAGCIAGIIGPALRHALVSVGYPQDALIAVLQDVYLLCWCLALVNLARNARDLRRLLIAWVWGSTAWAGLLIAGVVLGIAALSGVNEAFGVRAEGNFGDPNMAANYFALSLFVLWSSAYPRSRLLRAGIASVLLLAMVFTGSNGAFLNLGIGTAFVALSYIARRFGRIVLIAAVCLSLVVGAGVTRYVDFGAIQTAAASSGQPILRDWIGRSNSSASQRVVIVQEAWQLLQTYGPFGLGPNATKPLLTDTLAPYAHQAHDDYIAALVERGFLGAIALFVLICAIAFRSANALGGRLKADFAAVLPRREPLVGALLGLAVAAAYYEVLHFRHVWALLAIVAILQVWGRERRPA